MDPTAVPVRAAARDGDMLTMEVSTGAHHFFYFSRSPLFSGPNSKSERKINYLVDSLEKIA